MSEPERIAYEPRDQLALWYLANPAQPVHVGALTLVHGAQGVALRYDQSWLAVGFALSEDLPLVDELFLPAQKQSAAGAVDDARPDRWGERVIRKFERAPRMSLLEYLLFAGADRYGALGVSMKADAYVPWASSPIPVLGDLTAMQEVVRRILANEPVSEREQRLLRPGVSLGGARPKSLIEIDGHPWLVKFGEGEDEDTPLIEHAAMTLAAKCGVDVAATRAMPVQGKHAIAVQRFDRSGTQRIHAMSAYVALRAVGEEYGYPQLAAQLRRLCPADLIKGQQEQLFRRMVFNILTDNTDDHEKNHALLRQGDGSWLLAPAFDVVPSMSGLGYQAMLIGSDGVNSTLGNAMSSASAFGLKPAAAKEIVGQVASVVDGWHAHFEACGVSASDLKILSQYLDGDRLGAQRRSHRFGKPTHSSRLVLEPSVEAQPLAPPRG